ncbi:hypothetical protein E0W68_11650 [Flavobacterium salilacus subsp. salilacus]|uniref:hypothetical protein n=1 Tax=Flavobacterium TaxID=237 RepID=UPI00107521EF|nr:MULTISPECIES: hypothetical protein [Flavobacterium]KAF2516863.1 hypothetical protein E0W68_11650 [Flavobacterium salilacus subsp. salilacus]MBE1615778.1 hypothetical protein [Flavobacterium sp. SaA2.13]
MKNKLRLLAFSVSAGVLLLFTNCQKDDEATTATQSSDVTTGVKVSTISFDEFKRDANAYAALQKAVKGNTAKALVNDTINGFYYDDSNVTRIDYLKSTTYTFQIFREDASIAYYENLVIHTDDTEKSTSYIFEYHFDLTDVTNLHEDKQIINLQDKYKVKSGKGEPHNYIYQDGEGRCYILTSRNPDTGEYTGDEGIYYRLYVECPSSFSLSQDGSGNGSGIDTGIININITIPTQPGDQGPVIHPGGVISWPGGVVPEPVVTKPAVNFTLVVFKQDITPEEYRWLMRFYNKEITDGILKLLGKTYPLNPNADREALAHRILDFAMQNENNKELAKQLLEFLDEEEYSQESIEAAENAIEDIENGDIPDNIINAVTGECQANIVTDAYSVCSGLNTIFLDIYEGSDTYNVVYKRSAILEPDVAGRTDLLSKTTNSSGQQIYSFVIYLNNNYVNTATDISIATTVIHENLHAILLYFRTIGLTNINSSNLTYNPTYVELIDAYTNKLIELGNAPFLSGGNAHHEFMSYLVDNIAESIKAFGLSKGYQKPDSFYYAMAWQGLTHINGLNNQKVINPDFISLVPNAGTRANILNTLQAERINEEFNGVIPSYRPGSCN